MFGPGKPLAVLAYLLLAPGRSASRERLVDLLWSDFEPDAGRKQLRNALSSIRSRIGSWAIEDRDRSCVLSRALHSDVLDFRSAIERGCLKEALNLYREDFLTGFASPGATEFEHWAEGERTHFRSLAANAAEMCCREALDAGRSRDARGWADRLRGIDPNSELGWRVSLEVTTRTRDSLGAIDEAQRFEGWLRSQDRDPEPASRAALRAAREAVSTATRDERPDGPGLVADLVGRQREFNAVMDAWEHARAGRRRSVLLSGAAGLGKTRLIEELKRRFRFRRHRIAIARAYAGERNVPFSFLVPLVFELTRLAGAKGVSPAVASTLVGIDPRVADVYDASPDAHAGADLIARRSAALQELLAAIAYESPLALFIDDFHWVDESSRSVVVSALTRTSASQLLAVLASRAPIGTIEPAESEVRLTLAPLTEAEVEELIASLGALSSNARWSGTLVTRITRASSGNPLLVLAALRQLMSDDVIALDDAGWHQGSVEITSAIDTRLDPIGNRIRAISADQFRVLLACAIAGVPLSYRALTHSAVDTKLASVDTLTELERLGYLSIDDEFVSVAHDAIGEKTLGIADDPLRLEVQRELAAVLCDQTDTRSNELGVRLAIDAGAVDAAAPSLSRLVQARVRDTGQPVRSIVSSILGAGPSDPVVRHAIGSLPFTVRIKPRRIGIVITAAAILALLAARAVTIRAPQPDALLELVTKADPLHTRRAEISLRAENWNATSELKVSWSSPRQDTMHRANWGATVAPNRDAWMSTREDTTGYSVTLAGASGELARLTQSRADENPGSWSPDGKQATIETSQFGDSGHKVAAILDVASGRLRALTGYRHLEGLPKWSPDGTRIAVVPVYGDGTNALCIYTVDGSLIRCSRPGIPTIHTIGWIDDDRILAFDGATLVSVNADEGTYTPTGFNGPTQCDLSPDGRWMWCNASADGVLDGLQIVSTRDLQRPKRVVSSITVDGVVRPAWHWAGGHKEYLDSVAILAPSDTISLGAPIQLRAAGYTNLQRDTRLHALRWTSLDSTIASIDSTGTIHTHRQGRVTVEASAGGWRICRRTFVVAERPTPTLLTEDWHEPLTPRWQPFGIPRPVVVDDSIIGRAFLNNGDGNYFSGAYRVDSPFDGRDGLALDAVVRLRITRDQWQYLNLGFVELRDVANLRRTWDHRTGYLPHQYENGSCWFAYPSGEGPKSALLTPGGDGYEELPRRRGKRLPDIALGVPMRVRVQVFPDGRCGLALNGMALVIGPAAGSLDSLYLMSQGNSVGTSVLVGRLTVRRGVPTDVDWNRLPTAPRSGK